ncbi:M15 family metallopeptidase [Pseudoxanthomonas putridarboris]|uniref:D-alanyl-D-alanine dipeptidase n=2 Tax=Pseudoxanthomonas putridarboris TaxID=752605 RepID=A0ABU9IWG2_9GAMM
MGMLAAVLAQAAPPVQVSPARTFAQTDLVDVAGWIPDATLDIRYAGERNFIGAVVDGYDAPKCYLLRPVAEALAGVAADLRAENLRLVIHDCYRPVRAVKHFVRWAGDAADQRTKPVYYPMLDKSQLLDGYIAETSGHSRGATLDATLARCDGDACAELDMGTPFDFFDPRANTAHPQLSAEQRDNRQTLVRAMARHGFRNYPMEWWHYTLQPEPDPHTAYDVPIE